MPTADLPALPDAIDARVLRDGFDALTEAQRVLCLVSSPDFEVTWGGFDGYY
jgi:hypothetical protein